MKAFLFALALFASAPSLAGEFFATRNVQLNNQLFKLEIAESFEQRRQGLMYRKQIARNGGMLFMYQRPGNYRIWMKNTLIPLSVIWLDENATITGIKLLQPCRQIRCPVYGVKAPTRFIIELHPDQRSNFKVGQRLPALLEIKGTPATTAH